MSAAIGLFLKLPKHELGLVNVCRIKREDMFKRREVLIERPLRVQGCKVAAWRAADSLFSLTSAKSYAEHCVE